MLGKSARTYHLGIGATVACATLIVLVSCLFVLSFAQPARGAITWSGDIDPLDLTTWASATTAYVGNTGSGSLTIDAGSGFESYRVEIGYESGSSGIVTVDGPGSTWLNTRDITIGWRGSGVLNITNGGKVDSSIESYEGSRLGGTPESTAEATVNGAGSEWHCHKNLYVGYGNGKADLNVTNGGMVSVPDGNTIVSRYIDSSGTINFDNGTLNTSSLFCNFDDLTGTGTINTGGLISDIDLVFDASHGLNRTIEINDKPGQNVTLNLNVDSSSVIGAGYGGVGTMSISDGIAVESKGGIIGYKADSTGEVTVSGIGSTWTNSEDLEIGYSGTGTLNILHGGFVSNRHAYIGNYSGDWNSTCVVNVDGSDSIWTNSGGLYVGYSRRGILNITGGATVTSIGTTIGSDHGVGGGININGANSTLFVESNLYIARGGDAFLNITDGAHVSVLGNTWVKYDSESCGTINFDNGTLNTGSLFSAADYLTGTGTINTQGIIIDFDIVFDAAHPLNQTFYINDNPGQNITVNLNVDGSGTLGVGYDDVAAMSVADGVVVESKDGYIGYNSGSTGVVTVAGAGSEWANSGNLNVGHSGNGTLHISGGGSVSNLGGCIGNESDSTGVVTVEGTGSTWTNGFPLSVGNYGNGTLNITDGGAVRGDWCSIGNRSRSTGLLTVNGTGSTLANENYIIVGTSGDGTMSIANGGAAGNRMSIIGQASRSIGKVTVDGSGSTWTSSESLYVGDKGDGTLEITGGGTVISAAGYIGDNEDWYCRSTGRVVVDGAGSNWTSTFLLCVGGGNISIAGGDGSLSISAGGKVSSWRGFIGNAPGSTGEITVQGGGSMWTDEVYPFVGMHNGALTVGHQGNGTLNILDGGLVRVGGKLTIDSDSDGDGFINMATGGMLALYGDADDSLPAFLDLIDGTDAIRYWNDSVADWADITHATFAEDYTLTYQNEGDLAGYTVLTVGVPEPTILTGLLGLCLAGLLGWKRRR